MRKLLTISLLSFTLVSCGNDMRTECARLFAMSRHKHWYELNSCATQRARDICFIRLRFIRQNLCLVLQDQGQTLVARRTLQGLCLD